MLSKNRFICLTKEKISIEVKEIKEVKRKETKRKPKPKTEIKTNTKKEIIKKIYPNGDIYDGEMISGKKNGIGKMTFVNGNIFQGIWENDNMKHGKMIYTDNYKNQTGEYEGDFVNGVCHGNGIFISQEVVMSGQWEKDEIINGILDYKKYNNETMDEFEKNYRYYEGEIKYSAPDGYGKMIFRNGDIYTGAWKGGEIYGKGKMEYINGNIMIYYKTFRCKNQFAMLTTKRGENYLIVIKNNRKVHDMIKIPKTIRSVSNIEKIFSDFEISLVDDKSNVTEEEIDTITCPISFAPMLEPVITNCGHTFCKHSLKKLNGKCAMCRSIIEYYYPNDNLDEIYEKCKFSYSDCDGFMTAAELRDILRFIESHKFISEDEYESSSSDSSSSDYESD